MNSAKILVLSEIIVLTVVVGFSYTTEPVSTIIFVMVSAAITAGTAMMGQSDWNISFMAAWTVAMGAVFAAFATPITALILHLGIAIGLGRVFDESCRLKAIWIIPTMLAEFFSILVFLKPDAVYSGFLAMLAVLSVCLSLELRATDKPPHPKPPSPA
ncbi:hypothetical protein HY771_01525 [Candidatus Uhrbacteria bacterium]|nr:hypothetical protein [Candidatus Uhrbacteria bacterium]